MNMGLIKWKLLPGRSTGHINRSNPTIFVQHVVHKNWCDTI